MSKSKKPIKVRGKVYPSMVSAAKAHDFPSEKFSERIRSGWTPEQALELDSPPTFKHKKYNLTIEGKTYSKISELTREYGVSSSKIRSRIFKFEWTLRQAVELDPAPARKGRKNLITFREVTYRNRVELAREFGVKAALVQSRLSAGWTLAQSLGADSPPPRISWRRNADIIDGTAYPQGTAGEFKLYLITCLSTKKEYVGITSGTLEKRWGEHVSNATKQVDSSVKLYRAIRKYGVEQFSISLLRNDAYNYKELLQQEMEEVSKRDTFKNGYNSTLGGETTGTPRQITVKGKVFPTLTSAASYYGVNEAVIRSRLDIFGWTAEEAVEIAPRPTDWGPKSIIIEGVEYPSLKDAAKAYGKNYNRTHLRVTRYKWTSEQALDLVPTTNPPGAPKAIEFNNKIYSSNAKLAKDHDIKPEVLYSRLELGWSIGQALQIDPAPDKKKPYNAKSFEIGGMHFETMREMSNHYQISYKLVSSRLKKGYSLEEAVGLEQLKISRPKGKKVTLSGKAFDSLIQACEYFGVKWSTYKARISSGWTQEEALGIKPRNKKIS